MTLPVVLQLPETVHWLIGRSFFGLPRWVLRCLAGRPVKFRGRELELELQAMLRLLGFHGCSLTAGCKLDDARWMARLTSKAASRPHRVAQVSTQDFAIDCGFKLPTLPVPGSQHNFTEWEESVLPTKDLKVRLYAASGATDRSPLLVYLHGGGYVIGDLEVYEEACRWLCASSGAKILAVGYRLSPESVFPAALYDALSAYCWAASNCERLGIDRERLALGGDSAGANIAVAAAYRLRAAMQATPDYLRNLIGEDDAGGASLDSEMSTSSSSQAAAAAAVTGDIQSVLQDRNELKNYLSEERIENSLSIPQYLLLLYPMATMGLNSTSREIFGKHFFLDANDIDFFIQTYAPNSEMREHPLAQVQELPDLRILPSTYIGLAGFDPLRDEGVNFALSLAKQGVPVQLDVHHGLTHAFVNYVGFSPGSCSAVVSAGTAFRQYLGGCIEARNAANFFAQGAVGIVQVQTESLDLTSPTTKLMKRKSLENRFMRFRSDYDDDPKNGIEAVVYAGSRPMPRIKVASSSKKIENAHGAQECYNLLILLSSLLSAINRFLHWLSNLLLFLFLQ